MTDETADEEDRPEEKKDTESFLASFNRADAKLFLITFAGTVAANIVTVLVVAAAIILDRPQNGAPSPAGEVPAALISSAVGILGIIVCLIALRRKWGDLTTRLMISFLALSLSVLTMIFLLILLGDAAGVK